VKQHDTLANRLALILMKLNDGASLKTDELAKEFNVTNRTIQKDFNRLSFLPLKKENGRYLLDSFYLGKLSFKDIKNFSTLCGIKGLYPNLDDEFLKTILDSKISEVYEVKGHYYEDISKKQTEFKLIEKSIKESISIFAVYKEKERIIEPYKLINSKGIWYIAGVEDNKLKTFTFSKLCCLKENKSFTKDKNIVEKIENEEDIFFGNKKEVILHIDKEIESYFKRRQLIPYQEIIKETDDGLLVSTKIHTDEQILKIVRYWLPHIKIVSPNEMQNRLIEQMKRYLERD